MFIIYSFSVGFSSLRHLVVLVLWIFSFRETENFCLCNEAFKTGKNEIKSNVNKIMRTYLLCAEKDVSSVDEKKQEVTVIN